MGWVLASFLLVSVGATGNETPFRVMDPVPFRQVVVGGEFWGPRLEVNRTKSIPHVLKFCEDTGRIRNFAQTAGIDQSPFQGHIFHDSDVYKALEGVAHSLAIHPDPELKEWLDGVIDLVAKSQQEDGYLNTYFTMKAPDRRWHNLHHDHELYCAGHMFEAAVAHYEATGERSFLDVACRFADYIDTVFGEGKRYAVAGHEEIEMALIKLWQVTGEDRYLKLAKFFVEEHGQSDTHELYGPYCQDHKPVARQAEALGHAVRWMYLFSAVADLAAIRGDTENVKAMETLWQNIVKEKMYATGGVGVQGHGEGFAKNHYLPNYDAYCETCAAIGMVFWNHRLTLLHGEGRFADIVERELYNGALAGVSLDGARFFYVNPLASYGNHHRKDWYGCACCPTNMVRYVASMGQYVYGANRDGEGIYVLQYVSGSGTVPVNGSSVKISQETDYPWSGTVKISLEPKKSRPFVLSLRIPGWCESPSVTVNGDEEEGSMEKGFWCLRRKWKTGDVIELNLPMDVKRIEPDPNVEANAGRMALQRGPVVYCIEDKDHSCGVSDIALGPDANMESTFEKDLLDGVVVLRGKGKRWAAVEKNGKFVWDRDILDVTAIPYYAWDNREPGEMVVWIPTDLEEERSSRELTLGSLARPLASHCHGADAVSALNDGILPKNSNDHGIPRFTWWSHRGTEEWVSYEFGQARQASKVAVYWFDDTGGGACRVPKAWRLSWHDGKEWRDVEANGPFATDRDAFNEVSFDPVKAHALKIEVTLQPEYSGGILEWQVE